MSIVNSDSRIDGSHKASTSRDEAFNIVSIEADVVRLDNFAIQDTDLANHLQELPEDERSDELLNIMAVGLVVVRQVQARHQTDFVGDQIDELLKTILPQLLQLPETVKGDLLAKLGTGDGQALKPVKDNLDEVAKLVQRTVTEVRDFLGEQLDPNKTDAPLGRALSAVSEKLDPKNIGSVQHTVSEALKSVTGGDGLLAKTVKDTLAETLKPLQEKVDALGEEIRKNDAVAEVVDQTTLKGAPYEDRVARELADIGRAIGAHVDHVGPDNKSGDVIFCTDSSSVAYAGARIVVEARDQQTAKGRKALSDELLKKMSERDCNAGLYVCKTRDGLGKTLGDWVEGVGDRGPWIATTHEHISSAIRMLLVLHRLNTVKSETPDFDAAAVESQIQKVRTSLTRIQNIRSKANAAKTSMEFIGEESLTLKTEVNESLIAIEESLRKADVDES